MLEEVIGIRQSFMTKDYSHPCLSWMGSNELQDLHDPRYIINICDQVWIQLMQIAGRTDLIQADINKELLCRCDDVTPPTNLGDANILHSPVASKQSNEWRDWIVNCVCVR